MILEIISALLFLGVSAVFLSHNTFHPPHGLELIYIAGIILAFIAFAFLIFKEKTADEREAAHARSAARSSYLLGIALLVIAIIYQALTGQVDLWLVIVLCTMLVTKIISRIYLYFKM